MNNTPKLRPELVPNRVADSTTTNQDMWDWHREDCPKCPNTRKFIMGPPGFKCPICEWWIALP